MAFCDNWHCIFKSKYRTIAITAATVFVNVWILFGIADVAVEVQLAAQLRHRLALALNCILIFQLVRIATIAERRRLLRTKARLVLHFRVVSTALLLILQLILLR